MAFYPPGGPPIAILDEGITLTSAATSIDFTGTAISGSAIGSAVTENVTAGAGSVTSVSVVTANGVSGSVATATTTPAITLTLGDITPTSVSASGLLASATGLTLEETGAGTDKITLQAPASIAAPYTLTLPTTDGDANQVLTTDGSGVLTWTTNGAGDVVGPASSTDNAIARFDLATGKLLQNSGVLVSDSAELDQVRSLFGFTNVTLALESQRGAATDAGVSVSLKAASAGAASGNSNGGSVTLQVGAKNGSGADGLVVFDDTTNQATFALSSLSTDRAYILPDANGTITVLGNATTGSGSIVLATSPTLTTPVLGAATATSVNGLTITSSTGTLTITNGKTLSVSDSTTLATNSITFAGTEVLTLAATKNVTFADAFATSGANSLTLTTTGSTNVTLPTTGTLATLAGSETLSGKTLTEPKFVDGGFIADANGNEMVIFQTVASAVNNVEIENSITGANPKIRAVGDDANVGFNFIPKGTGKVIISSDGTQAAQLGIREDLDNGTNTVYLTVDSSLAADYTLTLPAATDTLVGKATTDTLTNKTISAATLSGTQLLAEGASIGLDPAGSADGAYSGITRTGTSGYAQAFGDLVYLDPTDSRWEAADSNSASGADGDARGVLGMVVVTGTDGNACTILLNGTIRADAAFPAMTVNAPMYVSETAGDIVATAPTTSGAVVRPVGYALTADELYFSPATGYQTAV